jgi:hypothetical protein
LQLLQQLLLNAPVVEDQAPGLSQDPAIGKEMLGDSTTIAHTVDSSAALPTIEVTTQTIHNVHVALLVKCRYQVLRKECREDCIMCVEWVPADFMLQCWVERSNSRVCRRI